MRELTVDEISSVAGGYAVGQNATFTRAASIVSEAAFRTAAIIVTTNPMAFGAALVFVTIGGFTYLLSQ